MAFEMLSPSDQVVIYLRNELLKHRWRNELPGTPVIAAELGVDRKTITAAINSLEEEGLLEAQGHGRPRKIVPPSKTPTHKINISILPYEETDRQRPFILNLVHKLQEAGHNVSIATKTLPSLGMDVERVARFVKKKPADLWIPICASRDVLEWFVAQNTPSFAIFGRRRGLPMGSIGPDKLHAMSDTVRRLTALGHRRIALLVRKERRDPKPGHLEQHFLDELEAQGITTGRYNLPEWEANPRSFNNCIDKILQHTPPTALLIDESPFYVAATQHLARRGIVAPRDISLVCSDSDPVFDWCHPKIASIHWPTGPVIKQTVRWVNQLSRGKNHRKPILTEAKFIDGGTIGPVPQAS